MKIKLDENVDIRVISQLRQAGHDVATVQGQKLTSAPDTKVVEVCHSEARCLITNDRGFGNRVRYNPANYSGIVIIRLPSRPTFEDWKLAISTLIHGFNHADVKGKLWIVKEDKIQEYLPFEND
jgi:predicted nuclease of predicted toxin-antitoxin system